MKHQNISQLFYLTKKASLKKIFIQILLLLFFVISFGFQLQINLNLKFARSTDTTVCPLSLRSQHRHDGVSAKSSSRSTDTTVCPLSLRSQHRHYGVSAFATPEFRSCTLNEQYRLCSTGFFFLSFLRRSRPTQKFSTQIDRQHTSNFFFFPV